MSTIRPMVPDASVFPNSGSIRKRYLLVCQFGLRLSLRPNSQTSNLYCHPSLQDCVRASLPQTC